MSHRRRSFVAISIAALVFALAVTATALAPAGALAQAGAAGSTAHAGPVQLTGMRTWVSPAGTRIVLEFSGEVVPVAPDSGSGPQLVVKDSPAEKAGIKRNDVIVDLNGSPVTDSDKFRFKIADFPSGARVKLGVLRDGKKMSFEVVLADRDTMLASNQG